MAGAALCNAGRLKERLTATIHYPAAAAVIIADGKPAGVIRKDNHSTMENSSDSRRGVWRFLDGSVSISISMLLAVALNYCGFCASVPALGFLHGLTNRDNGIIIVGTLLLLPTTAVFYGGAKMFFAAKEEYERRKVEREAERLRQNEEYEMGLTERGRQAGIQEERQRVNKLLTEHGVPLPPELASSLVGDKEIGRQEGIQTERERINKLLAEHGVALSPELARSLAGDTD